MRLVADLSYFLDPWSLITMITGVQSNVTKSRIASRQSSLLRCCLLEEGVRKRSLNECSSCTCYSHTQTHTHRPTHTHTHPFNGPFTGTTQVSRYQKGKTNLDFTETVSAVASSRPYASLNLAADRKPRQHPTTQFLQAGCPSCLLLQ